jgi:uncharacterized protein YkwD
MAVSTYEKRVVVNLNKVRSDRLVRSACLDYFAQRSAIRQVQGKTIHHLSMGPMMDRCRSYDAGECIAFLATNPYQMVQRWMRSPEHRPVLMRGRYHRIGVGAVRFNGMWMVVVRLADRSN